MLRPYSVPTVTGGVFMTQTSRPNSKPHHARHPGVDVHETGREPVQAEDVVVSCTGVHHGRQLARKSRGV